MFEDAYHGRTNLTMAMTAKNHPYKDGFGRSPPTSTGRQCRTPALLH